MVIERRADDVASCFVLEKQLFENGLQQEFTGEVTSVIGAGAFIAFGDGLDGLLPVRRLRGDWWEINELQTMLLGSKSERAIRIGDEAVVQVVKVDKPRGRVDLSPVQL
jgi:ribonuclease R